jgi:hypothetical protein
VRWIVIPDLQVPDHDAKAVASTYEFIKYMQPDGLLCVGDEADQPEPSRWNKGYAGEYMGTLQAGLDKTHEVLAGYRDALGDGPFHLMRSNHGTRIRTYLSRYAPALSGLRSLQYERLLDLESISVTYHDRPLEFAKGWVLAHGDEGSLSQAAGGTALGLAKKWGKSVVCGHTHRAGIQHSHLSLNGKISQHLFGLEVGHLMLYGNGKSDADYLKAGSANWQQAVAVIDVTGTHVQPTLIPIFNRRVMWEGKTF